MELDWFRKVINIFILKTCLFDKIKTPLLVVHTVRKFIRFRVYPTHECDGHPRQIATMNVLCRYARVFFTAPPKRDPEAGTYARM